jgi:hypothetical protein
MLQFAVPSHTAARRFIVLIAWIELLWSSSSSSSSCRFCCSAFTVTPQMTPERVVLLQLESLQKADMKQVFDCASPQNKAKTGPLEKFATMVQSPPYHSLVNHQSAELLLTTRMSFQSGHVSWSGLVRVLPQNNKDDTDEDMDDEDEDDDTRDGFSRSNNSSNNSNNNQQVVEYWWILSRCNEKGPYEGCYMVDSVIPNN